MKPTVGRIVHYYPDAEHQKKKDDQPCAAIITHVFSDYCVNLHVFSDGSHGLPNGDKTPTSVTRVDLVEGQDPPSGCWAWPPIPAGKAVDAIGIVKQYADLEYRVESLEQVVLNDDADPDEDMRHDDPDLP